MASLSKTLIHFFFCGDNEAQIWLKIKDNIRKFKDKPRLIFGSESENDAIDKNKILFPQ
jgi:hypothetical protein